MCKLRVVVAAAAVALKWNSLTDSHYNICIHSECIKDGGLAAALVSEQSYQSDFLLVCNQANIMQTGRRGAMI